MKDKANDEGAFRFCYIYNKQHGSALISSDTFERIKSILHSSEQQPHK